MRKEVIKVRAFDEGEVRNNSYNVQNMLLDQVNFPRFYHDGDYTNEIWSDIIPGEEWEKLIDKHFKDNVHSFEFSAPDRERMINLFRDLVSESVTGYRIVRYTNVSSGFPVYRFDLFGKSETTPSEETFTGQTGENVLSPKIKRLDRLILFQNS